MFENNNQNSQPLKVMPVFNNWNAVVEAWYCIGSIDQFKSKNLFSSKIGHQELVIFRTGNGKIFCLDAFCSHMGLRLSTGVVKNDKLQCKFHHWQYNGLGEVFDSGCKKISSERNLNSYPTEVRYGLIWVWAGKETKYALPLHPDFNNNEFSYRLGSEYQRPSHPHISLLNALDTQHVNTVHALELKVEASHFVSEDSSFIHYDFKGEFLKTSKKGKRNAWLSGGGYKFSVRYAGSTIGFLKALEGIKLFGVINFPTIYATFGYRQMGNTHTVIQPVFLTRKRTGIWGKIVSWGHLKLTEIIYNKLKNEDGEIYENIRFTPHLTMEDSSIASFISYVNRLPKSSFSIL